MNRKALIHTFTQVFVFFPLLILCFIFFPKISCIVLLVIGLCMALFGLYLANEESLK